MIESEAFAVLGPSVKKIPTNVITGFLGVGKTTTIRHLLRTKPADERWAVLVNEFGEVGIDGALLSADGSLVAEVAGGCICCKVRTLSRLEIIHLIEHHQPDRIIIEPTGLALPKQIIKMLSTDEFVARLDLQALVCLVDPFFFTDEQLLRTEAFANQISMADVVLATKADIFLPEHLAAFEAYVNHMTPAKQYVSSIKNGEVDWRVLTYPHLHTRALSAVGQHTAAATKPEVRELPEADAEGVVRLENRADFGHSCGWIFTADWQFSLSKLLYLYEQLEVPRVKGLFATCDGWVTINKMRETVTCTPLAAAADSRLEMIALDSVDWDEIDQQVRACRH
ncbi:MAG: CobW family GTP-binding protein [Pseudomonadota bacterium]